MVLTLDSTLQTAASDALHEYAMRVPGKNSRRPQDRGAAVLLNSQTGEVLALASEPAFDPAKLTAAQWATLAAKPDGPALNRAVSGLYPPGSVFKIVTAASALSHGLGNTVVVCHHTDDNVSWRFDGKLYARRRITDEEGFVPHGSTDLAKALRVSCNVYFANLGIDLGARNLDETARHSFALAHLPPLAKIGEDLPDCAYGQGQILVTPLEMASAAQAVAGGGERVAPTFVKSAPAPTPTPSLTPENAAALPPCWPPSRSPAGPRRASLTASLSPLRAKPAAPRTRRGQAGPIRGLPASPPPTARPMPSPASWKTRATGAAPPPPSAAKCFAKLSRLQLLTHTGQVW